MSFQTSRSTFFSGSVPPLYAAASNPAETRQLVSGKAELFTGALHTTDYFDISQPLAALEEQN